MKQDYDKTLEAIETICGVIETVEEALEDGKISWLEGGELFMKYGIKSVRAIGDAREIGQEVADTDPEEAEAATALVLEHFGGDNKEAREAVTKITSGLASMYQGAKTLIAIKKAQ